MKLLPPVLAVSVLLNIFFFFSQQHRESIIPESIAPSLIVAPSTFVEPNTSIVTQTVGLTWREIESTDFRVYIKNLRSTGCPELTVRDIIISEIDELYAKRYALLRATSTTPYWAQNVRTDATREKEAALREKVEQEKQALVFELLGIDLVEERTRKTWGPSQPSKELTFLPPEKRIEVRKLIDATATARNAIFTAADGDLTNEQRYELDRLEIEKEKGLASILSPAEFDAYQKRFSVAAETARAALAAFENPSEQDFLRLYQLRQQLEGSIRNINLYTPEGQAEFRRISGTAYDSFKERYGEEISVKSRVWLPNTNCHQK